MSRGPARSFTASRRKAGRCPFHFPPGTPGYAELIGKPGLTAILTMDRGTGHILGVKFLNRPEAA
jgi:hypothetical protein